MSVIESEKVDGVAIGHDGKTLVMLITDHLDWDKEYEHLMLLQAKINSYAIFIESKQYTNIYPNKLFDNFCIEIHFKYGLNENCKKFINTANKQLSELNINIISKDK